MKKRYYLKSNSNYTVPFIEYISATNLKMAVKRLSQILDISQKDARKEIIEIAPDYL